LAFTHPQLSSLSGNNELLSELVFSKSVCFPLCAPGAQLFKTAPVQAAHAFEGRGMRFKRVNSGRRKHLQDSACRLADIGAKIENNWRLCTDQTANVSVWISARIVSNPVNIITSSLNPFSQG
jgi:hypothetical protein